MSRKKDGDKIKLAEAKYITGESPEDIATVLGVSSRTIDRWAKDGNWDSHRQNAKSSNVIQLQSKPREKLGGTKLRVAVALRRDTSEELDDLEIIQSAIADIDAHWPEAGAYKAGMATALVKLIELKRKLKPETVVDLVERANVFLPDPSIASWVGDYVEEFSTFPNGSFDDQVDATSQAINWLASKVTYWAVSHDNTWGS